MLSTRSVYMTKEELAEALGVREALVRQWTRDGTIPPHFYQVDGKAYRYAPVTVALGELMLELGRIFGDNSPLPKQIARQAVPKLEAAWHEQPGGPARLSVQCGRFELQGPLTCLESAQQKLAAFATT
jgi:hypothetical protein